MRESLPSLHRLVVYNINDDVAAGRIAGELKAARVLFLTDIAGVLDKNMELLKSLTCDDIDGLIEDETITGGMIPRGENEKFCRGLPHVLISLVNSAYSFSSVTFATDAVCCQIGSQRSIHY